MSEVSTEHPGMLKVFIKLMKLRVIILLQVTAICAILVHDLLARYGSIDAERTWLDTVYSSFITIIGGTLSAGATPASTLAAWRWDPVCGCHTCQHFSGLEVGPCLRVPHLPAL